MYFCNLLYDEEKSQVRQRVGVKRGITQVHTNVFSMEEDFNFVLNEKDGVLLLQSVSSEVPQGCKILDVESESDKQNFKSTAENPVIWVLCKSFRVFDGIKAYIKYINISEDYVLVALFDGCMQFEDADGEFITLTRSNSDNVHAGNKSYFKCNGTTLSNNRIMCDKETGYSMVDDMIVAVVLKYSAKANSNSFSGSRENSIILTDAGVKHARQLKAEKEKRIQQKKEEEKLRRAQAERKAREEKIRKEEELEKQNTMPTSEGAAFFMSVVQNLKGKR